MRYKKGNGSSNVVARRRPTDSYYYVVWLEFCVVTRRE